MGGAQEGEPLGAVRWIWVGAIAAAALAAAAVVAIAHGGRLRRERPAPAPSVRASLDHSVEFGDPVTATITVFLDRDVDVRVSENLAPLTQLGRTHVTEADRGDQHLVTYTTRASCLDQRCVSTTGGKRIAFRPAVVEVAPNAKITARWPALDVRARVSREDAAKVQPPLRRDATPPPVTYRVGPDTLARTLSVVAAVLAAAGLLLAVWAATALLRRRRVAAPLTGLERALALAREAERGRRPTGAARSGCSHDCSGRVTRASRTRLTQLAWSAPRPTATRVADLVTQVERR
jgi:hypothetical protein